MRLSVLYFAGVRDLTGTPREELAIPDDVTTVGDLRALLEERKPMLKGKLGAVRFAVNEEFGHDSTGIKDADVVAVIPPVAGG